MDEIINACKNGNLRKFIKLSNKIDIHLWDDYLLRCASANGSIKIVEFLLEHNADIHVDDDYPIQLASENGHSDVVEYLKFCNLITVSLKNLSQYNADGNNNR